MKKIRKFIVLFCVLIASTSLKAQQFDSIKNIEKFLTLTPKNLDSKLLEYGYTFDEKRIDNKMTVKNFKKNSSESTVSYGFENNKIVMFMWNEDIDKGVNIVQNIDDCKNYLINESKTKDDVGIFYMQSKTTDLDIIIYRTADQAQKGKIAFNLFRNKEKDLTELKFTVENNLVEKEDEPIYYTSAGSTEKPEYVGGVKKMNEYLSSCFDDKLIEKYKKENSLMNFKVKIFFTVNENGSITVNYIEGIDSEELINEIKAGFEKMPKWKCGGIIVSKTLKPQKMKMNLPITF
jgi:hypothetical protein